MALIPTAFYNLDVASGNATDDSGNGNTLTNNGTVTYSAGKINNGADFGAANTTKFLAISSALADTSTSGIHTLTGWFNLTTSPASGVEYELMGASKNGGRQNEYKYSNASGTPVMALTVFDGVGAASYTFALAAPWTTGTWHFVAFTVNGNSVECFVDNVSRGTATITQTNNSATTNSFRIANHPTVNANMFCGLADMVGVFPLILNSTDLSALWNSGNAKQYPFGTAYTITAAVASFTLTGIAALFHISLNMSAVVQAYTLTGIAALFKMGKGLVAQSATFVLTGYDIMIRNSGWTNMVKSATATMSNATKSISIWTNRGKNQ